MCDQFAIASSDNMNVYANLYNDFQECINNLNSQSLDYHPEICLLMQLNRHNISTIRSSFNIGLRIFPPDLEKWG
jgi:hypothetical protein